MLAVLGAFWMAVTANAAQDRPERRVALVIGNADYKSAVPLDNPLHDAEAIAAALKSVGFEVLSGLDLDTDDMREIVRRFGTELRGADIGLFYYAGHGIQVDGVNYLVPIDAEISHEADLEFDAMALDVITRQMELGAAVKIVLLDACRNNPFERSLARSMGTRAAGALGRGLAPVQPAGGALIGFATDPGDVALDGDAGANSPFTAALLRHIATPGLEINVVMTRVRADVFRATEQRQRPWTTSSLIGEVYLAAGPAAEGVAVDEDVSAWKAAEAAAGIAGYEDYRRRFPQGLFAELAEQRIAALGTPAVEGATASDSGMKSAARPAETAVAVVAPATDAASDPDPPGTPFADPFRDCELCPELVGLPPGSFEMGSQFGPSTEKPPVRRTVPAPVAIGRYEVTEAEWEYCRRAGACRNVGTRDGSMPVTGVSWEDAQDYVGWLATATGKPYRLPTETEWEYAARGGQGLKYPTGPVLLSDGVNYAMNHNGPIEVGRFPSNAFGLHDLAGNVWEWVEDCALSYADDAPYPSGGESCLRVLRGGSFRSAPDLIRSANRHFMPADTPGDDFGFRVARDLAPGEGG